ncbi:MAG: RluA family pseudouridine synthase, partial [Elusimicrobia bacterium]|nr:RluA family pseudouridine synthase [Elusimicrobiota bacterium]
SNRGYSRTYFQKLIDSGLACVNGKTVLSSHKLKYGDEIYYEIPDEVKLSGITPQKIALDIIFEDLSIIIINKPSGLVVHPSYGHEDGTLLNALYGYAGKKFIPYMVHRLDKDTSGLIVFAKNEKAKINLSKQFQKRTVKKIYYTAVLGIITENRGRIEAPLGRSKENRKVMSVGHGAQKMAITEFKVISRKDNYSLVEVNIITGRTHQIRGHMKYINHPVLGDTAYGGPAELNGIKFPRQMLHSFEITFTHPESSKNVTFKAPVPKDMKNLFKDK